jgi:hypothetical protein
MASKGSCKADNCSNEVRAKGYCKRHYAEWRKGKLPKPRYKTCNAENCRKPMKRRGLCEAHFAAQFRKKASGPAPEPPPAA